MINKLLYAHFVILFDIMGTFHILTDVIFVRSDIYKLKQIRVFS